MNDRPQRSRWNRWALIAFVLLLPVWYVLSIGPAAWLLEHGHLSERTFGLLYMPIGLAASLCRVVDLKLGPLNSRAVAVVENRAGTGVVKVGD